MHTLEICADFFHLRLQILQAETSVLVNIDQ